VDVCLSLSRYPDERGRRIENLVAIELVRRKSYFQPSMEISHYKSPDGKEVDFVIGDGSRIRQLIQVCHDVEDPATKKREVRALLKASKELKCPDLLVVTWDHETEEEVTWRGTKRKVRFVPLWRWLLDI